jgi:hypothetical protein
MWRGNITGGRIVKVVDFQPLKGVHIIQSEGETPETRKCTQRLRPNPPVKE